MIATFRSFKSLAAAAAGICVFAGPTMAESQFTCVFEMECLGVDNPCTQIEPLIVNLLERDNIWGLQGPEGDEIVFVPVEAQSEGVFTLMAGNSDPDASATSMLSLFEGGQAILTTHGDFVTPGVITQVGTCKAKERQ